ncbi:hypothetical protein [Paenibacillus medicaginis]|uniref:DUF5348 domain-containing protein n=1 Tax=Paenibacillus medicaginis TaxID=1470560 RepID=A0ABV5BUI2_9BACL
MSNGFKYENETKVKMKHDLHVGGMDYETGEGYETFIPEGAIGEIDSCGRDSHYGYREMFDVVFRFNGEEATVTFLLEDLEDWCTLERVDNGE